MEGGMEGKETNRREEELNRLILREICG